MDNIARNPLPRVVLTMISVALVAVSIVYLVPSGPSFGLLLGLTIFPVALLVMFIARLEYLWMIVVLSFVTLPYLGLRVELGSLLIPAPAFLAVSALVAILARTIFSGAARPIDRRLLAGWSLFFIANLLSIYNSVFLESSLSFLFKWVFHGVLFLALILSVRGQKNVKLITFAFIMVATVMSLQGLYRYFMQETARDIDLFGEYATRDAPAYYLAITLPLIIALLWDPMLPLMKRGLLLFAVAASGTALVFTYTRAAWLSVFVALLISGFFQRRAWLICAAALVIAAVTAPQAVMDRFTSIYVATDVSGSPYRSSSIERYYVLMTARKMIENHPLIGVGVGTYERNYHQYRESGASVQPKLPHNEYLRTWAEGGIGAIVALLWLTTMILCRLLRVVARASGAKERPLLIGYLGSAVSVFVYALLSNNLNTMLTWLILATGMVLADEIEEERSANLSDLQR